MAPDKMKQWTTGLDGIDKLQMEEADVPSPGEGEVLVKIHAVSLNYRDKEGESAPHPRRWRKGQVRVPD